jgi:hypothetical protein
MSIFGEETIPVGASPEDGHDDEAAVDPDEEYADRDDLDNEDGQEEEEIDDGDGEKGQDGEDGEEDESPEEGHDSDLLAGKYKSPEDLAKAYQNAQRKISQQAEEIKNLRGQQSAAPGQQQSGQQSGDLNKVFWQNFQTDPLGTMRYLIQEATKQQVAPILQQREMDTLGRNINALAKEYRQVATEEGMTQLMGKVAEIAQELGNPALANNPSPRILKLAAEESFGSTKQALYNQAKKAGREEAEKTRQRKQTGLSAPKGAKRSPLSEQPKSEEDQIREGIMAHARGGGIFG